MVLDSIHTLYLLMGLWLQHSELVLVEYTVMLTVVVFLEDSSEYGVASNCMGRRASHQIYWVVRLLLKKDAFPSHSFLRGSGSQDTVWPDPG